MYRYVGLMNITSSSSSNSNRLRMLLGRASSLASLSLQAKTNVMKVISISIYTFTLIN